MHPHRILRRSLVAALLICGVLAQPLLATSLARKKEIAHEQFDKAERMREALNGRPTRQRTIHDYQHVMDAYRRVYYVAPNSVKADDAIVAVAELLAEKGRQFHSEATLKDAIGQYELLRKEYPGSKYRLQALLTIGQIYKDDLNDPDQARATFEEYLKHYPHSQLADQAKQALKELDEFTAKELAAKKKPEPEKSKAKDSAESKPPAEVKQVSATGDEQKTDSDDRGPTSLVTGVRHWSTPDYTRIAIDLEDEVTYDSGRIPHPDRIYFDLKDTRLSSVLKGKTFDVDDGFLKKIRVAQFAPGITRVVLEVGDDVGDYSAFILPNPYRLVIDIHSKTPAKLMARTQNPQPDESSKKLPDTKDDEPKQSAKKTAREKKSEVARVESKEEPKKEVAELRPEPKPVETRSEPIPATKKEVPLKIVEADQGPEKPAVEAKLESKPEVTAKSTPSEKSTAKVRKSELPLRVRGHKIEPPETLNVHTAAPTTDGDRSLIRALGLKIGRIVVDAGHGGHDTGTIGPNGLREKDLVLDVSLRLGKLLESRLGADVIYTRDDDTFIPLETRTAIANQQQADLFISVHANSSRDASARGVETYYLNFTSSRDALAVAARENAVSEKSIHELQDLVKKIALKEKIEESREFALDVQNSLHSGLASKAPAIRDRGVKQAPFIVLIGANMPSILAEISFISNPTDAKKLETPEYRQKIAESLYKGIAKYVNGLSGIKVAAKFGDKDGD